MQRVTGASSSDILSLPAELRPVLEQNYPRFSDAEYARRHNAWPGDGRQRRRHLLIVSAQNVGNATRWVTSWPGTTQALLIFEPGEKMTMHVEYTTTCRRAPARARRGCALGRGERHRPGDRGARPPWSQARRRHRAAQRTAMEALEAKVEVVSLDAD